MLLGGLAVGPVADRIGRRRVILLAIAWFSVLRQSPPSRRTRWCSAGAASATGLGLGALLARAVALTVEFAPARRRQIYNGLLSSGFPIGGLGAALVALAVVDARGWRPLVYGLNTWLPQPTRHAGYPLGSSLQFLLMLNLGALVLDTRAAAVSDRASPKWSVVLGFAAAPVRLLVMAMGPGHVVLAIAGSWPGSGTRRPVRGSADGPSSCAGRALSRRRVSAAPRRRPTPARPAVPSNPTPARSRCRRRPAATPRCRRPRRPCRRRRR